MLSTTGPGWAGLGYTSNDQQQHTDTNIHKKTMNLHEWWTRSRQLHQSHMSWQQDIFAVLTQVKILTLFSLNIMQYAQNVCNIY